MKKNVAYANTLKTINSNLMKTPLEKVYCLPQGDGEASGGQLLNGGVLPSNLGLVSLCLHPRHCSFSPQCL